MRDGRITGLCRHAHLSGHDLVGIRQHLGRSIGKAIPRIHSVLQHECDGIHTQRCETCPYAVFQDWQAEFSDDLRATIIDSYARPRTEMLVVQQYGTLTPIIADILDTKYQFVRSVTDASGTYDIYRCRYSV